MNTAEADAFWRTKRMDQMKKYGIMLLFMLFSAALFAGDGEIDWVDGYDEALEIAGESDTNIFLLITAPSWCYWCTELENNVLSQAEVIDAINEGFIPLKVLDTDRDISRFNFEGYPTVRILSPEGKVLEDVYSQNSDEVLEKISSYSGRPPEDEDLLVGGEYPIDPDNENALKAYEILADFMQNKQPDLIIEPPVEAAAQIVAGYLISINCPCIDPQSGFEGNISAEIYFIWDDSFEIMKYELAMSNRS